MLIYLRGFALQATGKVQDRELLRHYIQSVVQPSHIAGPINLQAYTYGKENHFWTHIRGRPNPHTPIKPLLNHTNSQDTPHSSAYNSATQPSRTWSSGISYKRGELRVAAQYPQWVKHVLGRTWERKERVLGAGFERVWLQSQRVEAYSPLGV